MIKIFDFFCGCGGTSLGFADSGLEVVFGLDIDEDSIRTCRENFPKADFVRADIRSLNSDSLSPFIRGQRRPLLFSGCAPCQPFSKQNRQRRSSDPRSNLLEEFARFVEAWLPDYVFIENVPGLQRVRVSSGPLRTFKRKLTALGYSYKVGVLPALWFGVPQMRERLVMVASLVPGLELPERTHGFSGQPVSTVRNWIGDLPPIEAGEVYEGDPDHCASKLSKLNIQRIAATPEGGGRENWPGKLLLPCHREHVGHSDVYGRLAWDKPAAGLTTRCISYSNGRFGHPEQNRAISVREAACLQTFPRDYVFVGSMTSKARQIGNAVPPLMARSVGQSVLRHFLAGLRE